MKTQETMPGPGRTDYLQKTDEPDPRWQKHVMALLWVLLVTAVVLISFLFYADGHGFFQSHPGHNPPTPAWPEGEP
jgi:hypothetical protein